MKKFIEQTFHIVSEGWSDSFNGTCIVINYKNKTIEYATILLINPMNEYDIKKALFHEMRHYFIDYANNMGILVNITTNGYLINKIKDNKNIHRLNISMHSFNSRYGIEIDEYIDNVFLNPLYAILFPSEGKKLPLRTRLEFKITLPYVFEFTVLL